MEAEINIDLKVYQYESMEGERGRVISIFANIKEASLACNHDEKKIRHSILTGDETVTRRIMKDQIVGKGGKITIKNNSYLSRHFFSAGLEFESKPVNIPSVDFFRKNLKFNPKFNYFKRIVRYDNGGNKIYDYENIWVTIEEDDILISNTGLVKTVKGKINKGYSIKGKYYIKIGKDKKYLLLQDLITKYFDSNGEPENIDIDIKTIRIIKVDKNFNLRGYYESYKQAAEESSIDWRTVKKYIDKQSIDDNYLWFSDDKDCQLIDKYMKPDLTPNVPLQIDETWRYFIRKKPAVDSDSD